MTYARITVKCNYDFIKEINGLIAEYDGYIRDFFEQTKKEAFAALEKAGLRNDDDCNLSTEVTITCPHIIWTVATELLPAIPKDCSDVYYMLTLIAAIPENKFAA